MRLTTARAAAAHYRILVVGGGTAGCSVSHRFRKLVSKGQLAVVEPALQHYYQAGFTLVGGGLRSMKQCVKPMQSVLHPDNVWIKQGVAALNPKSNSITLADGSEVKYDLLIVAAGLELRYDMVGGLSEALKDAPNVCSIYRADLAEKTYRTLQQFSKGDALFTLPNAPIKCSGAAQKICYLADEIFRKRGVRENIRMTYYTYLNDVFDVPKYAKALNVIVKQKGIQLNVRRNLKSIDVIKGEALFEIVDVNAKPTGETEIQKFDFLHASPPCSAPKVIRECADLANAAGWLDIDAKTLQSKRFPNVFGIGDCNGSPNKKTAAAIYSQMRAIATNVPAFLKGKPLTGEYNCYSSCPLIVGNNRVVLAEFTPEGPLETLPFDQGRPLYTAYLLKRYVLPFLYWQFGVKGTWLGPATVRKILHLGMTK